MENVTRFGNPCALKRAKWCGRLTSKIKWCERNLLFGEKACNFYTLSKKIAMWTFESFECVFKPDTRLKAKNITMWANNSAQVPHGPSILTTLHGSKIHMGTYGIAHREDACWLVCIYSRCSSLERAIILQCPFKSCNAHFEVPYSH